MIYGYIRVSTDKQDVENQKIGINQKAIELNLSIDEWIADEGVSGVKEVNERNLGVLIDKVKEGDIIIISEISRLARSVFMLFRIVEELVQKKNILIYTVKDSISALKKDDLMSVIGITFLGIAAQVEREMIIKRTREGIERRRRDGVIFGRPIGATSLKKLDGKDAEIRKYITLGVSYNAISKLLDVNRGTLHRYCEKNGIEKRTNSPASQPKRNGTYEALNTERENIKSLIMSGYTPTAIASQLNVNVGTFISWYNKQENRDVYNLLESTNKRLRLIHNANCGRDKRRAYGSI